MKTSRTKSILGLAVLIAVVISWTLNDINRSPATPPSTSPELTGLLAQVRVSSTSDHTGYDRDCGPGHRCVFGPAWTDDYEGPGGHDGCDTRNNVLQRDLSAVRYRAGTHNCVVIAGQLRDPYTGGVIDFKKSAALEVQIDHIYPLSAAWNRGAAAWPIAKRIQFATPNDVRARPDFSPEETTSRNEANNIGFGSSNGLAGSW